MPMRCPKCGAGIEKANARFCEKCGAVLSKKEKEPENELKTYVLRCKSCGGTLNLTEDEDVLICPYCGSKEIIEESDAVKIEKMRTEAELKRQKMYAERMKENKRADEAKGFRKSRSYKFAVLLLVLSLFGCLLAFSNRGYASGIVSIIQIALLILAFLSGYKVLKTKIPNLHVFLILAAAVLIFVYLGVITAEESRPPRQKDVPSWDSLELSSVIPEPEGELAYVYSNSSERLSCDIDPCTAIQFKAYIDACKEAGFTVDAYAPYDGSFTAYNEEGYRLDLYHYSSDYLSLYLDAPIEMSEFIWPNHGLSKLLSAPQSGYGKIASDSTDYFNAYIGETTKSDYVNYVTAVMEAGFDVDYYRNDTSFSAKNADGVRVSVDYQGNKTMYIRLSDYS